MHHRRVILVVLMLLLSGCSGVFGTNSGSPTATTTSPTSVAESTETDSEPTPEQTTTESSSAPGTFFTESSATGEILVQVSDLPSGYVLDGESIETRGDVDNETAETFKTEGIVRLHDRVYLRDDSDTDGATYVLVSAVVFESNGEAADYLQSFTTSLEANGTAETIDIGEDGSAEKIRFVNERGLQNVVVVSRVGNLVFYTVTSDSEQYYESQARELFITMYVDAEERAE